MKVKNSKHGIANPNARYKKLFTEEEVLNSPLVAEPLRLFEICATSDGGAALVLSSMDFAKKHGVANPVRVTGPLASPSVAVTVLPTRRRATAGLLAGLINPALMLVTFADLASGGGNKCLAAAEGLGGEREN